MAMDIVNKQATKVPKLLVAPIEKIDVPNHLLNTSNKPKSDVFPQYDTAMTDDRDFFL
jgi:hypothetical protein